MDTRAPNTPPEKKYSLKNKFNYGYRNKEDVSNLPPNVLVVGSQNVLTNAAERVGIRQGYVLDGAAGDQNTYGIDSSYDFLTKSSGIQNLRKWGTALEVRYENPNTLAVSWINILNTLTATKVVNFTNFWDFSTELSMFCLFVNGSTNIYEWTGGIGAFDSADNTAGHIAVLNATPTVAGTGYVVGDVVTITTGGTGGTATVTAVGGGGTVTTVSLTSTGSGYTTGAGKVTTGGSGDGALTLNITTVATGAVTIQGTRTIAQLGFYTNSGNSAKFKFILNGVTYTYTAYLNETFLGISPNPLLVTNTQGDAVIQSPATVAGSSVSSLPTGFVFDLISTLDNQIWYGQFDNVTLYISKVNNYKDVTFTAAQRLPAEGALIVLDSPPIGFSPQNTAMYITAGRNEWWLSQKLDNTVVVAGVATQTQILFASKLKLTFNQASQSQALMGNFKNSICFVSNEQIINTLGLVENIQQQPQVTNISDPIKFDIDAYDFTGGQVLYDNYYIYVCVPVESVVRMYNVQKRYWEAPQVLPVSRFYHVNDVVPSTIYGHSSLTNESYQMFTGYNDNGNPINAVAAFPYVSIEGGDSSAKKVFNGIYTEGYISTNTTLSVTINYEFGGFLSTYNGTISGVDPKIIFNRITDGSIGQNTLGSQPIGTILNLANGVNNPKFRKINTMNPQTIYEYQVVYSSNDTDFQWEILRWGTNIGATKTLHVEISE